MVEQEKDTLQKIRLIKNLFSAEEAQDVTELHSKSEEVKAPEQILPDQETRDFLDEREEFRDEMLQELNIDSYLQNYESLCRYGLDEYFMDLLKWEINIKLGNDPDIFFSPEFELRYKNQEEMLELVEDLKD